MSKKETLVALKQGILDLEDEKVFKLVKQGLKEGISPTDIILEGLNPGLSEIGEGFVKNVRFMSDLMLAGDIMTEAMEILRPEMEKGAKTTGDVMILGAVEGDQHTIGKKMVQAMFIGAGFQVHDIGEDCEASKFVEAVKKYKANVLGMSAILSGTKPYCKVVIDALKEAGLRDDMVIAIGGWEMTQNWVDQVGADCFGENAIDGLHNVQAILAGERKKKK